ncbi:MAG: hypothetical protein E7573_10880 [Ruminococcaceae bacterium]|nr:hypothetical protein [Oscillospiraceae bacterium]
MNRLKKSILSLLVAIIVLISIIAIVGAKTTNSIGDINADGTVSAADARLALRASVGLEKLTDTQFKSADVNNDSKVTAADARTILRVSVGLEKFVDSDSNLNDETIKEMSEVDNAICDIMNSDNYENADKDKKEQLVNDILEELENQGMILKNSIKYNEETEQFTFQYSSGISGWVLLNSFSNLTCSNGFSNDLLQSINANTKTSFTTSERNNIEMVFMYGFDNSLGSDSMYGEWDNLLKEISKLGFTTTIYDSPRIVDYKTAFLETDYICILEHGEYFDPSYGIPNGTYGFIVQGEYATAQTEQDYAWDLYYNRIGKCIADGASKYFITPKFFEDYYEHDKLYNSIVFLFSCRGFGQGGEINYSFAKAFHNSCGASTVIGFHNAVFVDYAIEIFNSFTNDMMYGCTADEALENATDTYCKDDIKYMYIYKSNSIWWSTPDEKREGKTGKEIVDEKFINDSSAYPIIYGDKDKRFDIVLSSITGTVTERKTGIPISNVTIEVIDNESGSLEPVATTTTDANGKYSLTLPCGSYSISFNHENYEYYGTSLSVNYEAYEENATLSPKSNSGNTEERTVIDSGNCGADGDNVTWTLYEDGELVISDIGEMEDYSSPEKTPWNSYRKSVKSVIIKSGVISIGNFAFCDCPNLINISIPTTVTSIGDAVFEVCVNLTSIIIPESVTSIGIGAFIGCNSLTSITIEENNKYYSNDSNGVLFNKDKTILIQYPSGNRRTKYIIPDSVTSIGDSAFVDCPNLINISIPNSVITSIGHYAFFNCVNLTSITIPDSVTSIGHFAFCYCDSLTSIKMPKSLTSIDKAVFYNCDSLESIEIPDSVTIIGSKAFYDCDSLTSIEIPDSVTSIGSTAFLGCDSLTSIKIPKRVTKIGNFAFSDCTNLTSITIPNSVTNIGDYAFFVCNKLTNVYYTGTKQEWRNITIGDNNKCLTNATIHYNS